MVRLPALLLLVLTLAACAAPATPTPPPTTEPVVVATSAPTSAPPVIVSAPATLTLTSTVFAEGTPIPVEFSCDGTNVSPPLAWSAVPAGTQSLVLIVEDLTEGNYTHWVLFNVGADTTALAADIADGEEIIGTGRHAQNSSGNPGYDGPCPDPGDTNTYTLTLYALDTTLQLLSDPTVPLSKGMVRDAMQGHILGEGILTAIYTR